MIIDFFNDIIINMSKVTYTYPKCQFDYSKAGFAFNAATARRISPLIKAIISSYPTDSINTANKCNLAANILHDLLLLCNINVKNNVTGRYEKPKLITTKEITKYVTTLTKNNQAKYEHIINTKKINDIADLKSFTKDIVTLYTKSCSDEHAKAYKYIKDNKSSSKSKAEAEDEYEYYDE